MAKSMFSILICFVLTFMLVLTSVEARVESVILAINKLSHEKNPRERKGSVHDSPVALFQLTNGISPWIYCISFRRSYNFKMRVFERITN